MYTECLNCPKLGISCDGPNFAAMSSAQLIKWCKLRKTELGMSNQKLADLSGVPIGTINRLLSETNLDFKHETMRSIIQVLVGGDWNGFPCPNPDNHAHEAAHEKEENDKLRAQIQKLESSIESIKADERRRIEFLKEEVTYLKGTIKFKNIFLIIFAVALAVALFLIIGFLLYDFTHPDWGVFWLANK